MAARSLLVLQSHRPPPTAALNQGGCDGPSFTCRRRPSWVWRGDVLPLCLCQRPAGTSVRKKLPGPQVWLRSSCSLCHLEQPESLLWIPRGPPFLPLCEPAPPRKVKSGAGGISVQLQVGTSVAHPSSREAEQVSVPSCLPAPCSPGVVPPCLTGRASPPQARALTDLLGSSVCLFLGLWGMSLSVESSEVLQKQKVFQAPLPPMCPHPNVFVPSRMQQVTSCQKNALFPLHPPSRGRAQCPAVGLPTWFPSREKRSCVRPAAPALGVRDGGALRRPPQGSCLSPLLGGRPVSRPRGPDGL